MRAESEYIYAKELLSKGMSESAAARHSGIPRVTIRDWLQRGFHPRSERTEIENPATYINHSEKRRSAYAFILGEYLGDGCVRTYHRGVFRLDIYNDARYEGLNQLIEQKLAVILPDNKVGRILQSRNCWDIYVYSKNIPVLFPQMGAGRKHNRKIRLRPWQIEIIDDYPNEFIKGLIYSDGCIYDNNMKKGGREYSYRSYSFSNKSKDIANYLSRSLKRIGIDVAPRWAKNGEIYRTYKMAIYRKRDRLILGRFIQRKEDIPLKEPAYKRHAVKAGRKAGRH